MCSIMTHERPFKTIHKINLSSSIAVQAKAYLIPLLLLTLAACRLAPEVTPTVTQTLPPSPSTTPTSLPTPTVPLPGEPTLPEEAVLILEPGPGSILVSPAHISGVADSTFEQNLVVRILLDDGSIVAFTPTTIQSELGQRGPFKLDVPFSISGQRQGFIQVYSSSPRDGGITHLASVNVTLSESGPQAVIPTSLHPERIFIYAPQISAKITGGIVHVEGYGVASFEQTLVAEVYDVEGNLVGSQPLIIEALEMGQPGSFSVDVAYTVHASAPGRIVVRDPSVAFGGDVHLASVEVLLEP